MRRPSIALLLLAGLLLTAACSKPAEAPPAAPDPMITLRVVDWSGNPALDSVITAFYREQAHIRVERLAWRPSGEVEALRRELSAMAREGKADLFLLSLDWLKGSEGSLLPLDPHIQRSRFDLAPFGLMADQLRQDGQLYSLPFRLQPQAVLYNKELVAKAGVTMPAESWSWEQFRQAAARMTQHGANPPVWGFSAVQPELLARSWVAGRTGGRAWLEQERDVAEHLRLLETMVRGDRSMRPLVLNASDMHRDFEVGQAAMTLWPIQNITWMTYLPFPWDMAPFPTESGQRPVGYGEPVVLAVGLGSPHPEAAWEFIRFATGPEGARRVARCGSLPGYLTADVRQAWFEQVPAPPPGTEALFRTAWALPVASTGEERPYAQAMHRAQITVLSGARDWEYAARAYLEELKRP